MCQKEASILFVRVSAKSNPEGQHVSGLGRSRHFLDQTLWLVSLTFRKTPLLEAMVGASEPTSMLSI